MNEESRRGGIPGGGAGDLARAPVPAMEHEVDQAVAAVAQVRQELPTLVPDDASGLGSDLDALLHDVGRQPGLEQRQALVDQMFELLSQRDVTQQRLNSLLASTAVDRGSDAYGPLEGNPLFDYDSWVCPNGDYVFPMIDADDQPPDTCPNDGSPLDYREAEA
jgi:hypothetical protein